MALYRSSSARLRRFAGPAKPWAFALALGTSALLSACGAGSDAASPTAVAGDAMSLPTSKPIDVVVAAASESPLASGGAVPTVAGKVRYGVPASAALGEGASLNGAVPFPRTDLWNRDVSQSAADPMSDALVASIGRGQPLRAAFGNATGTPYVVVDRSQATVAVRLASSRPPRAWPIPPDAPVSTSGGRVIVVDRDAGLLYELLQAVRAPDGSWDAAGGTVRRLDVADAQPTDGALDEAGLDTGAAAFPGLVRFDEAAAGAIRHALRISVPRLGTTWLPPAMRAAPARDGQPGLPPTGLRLRLKASFEIPAAASPQARAILQALKTYGAIVAGEGPAWSLDGVPHAAWDMATLGAELAAVCGADFEVVATDRPAAP
jgi:hypothetical protein